MTMQKQIDIATDLIDFCGGDLSVSGAAKFFMVRDYDLTEEEKRRVLLTALTLIRK